jgi:putative AdoMet-dependent methyltransferase
MRELVQIVTESDPESHLLCFRAITGEGVPIGLATVSDLDVARARMLMYVSWSELASTEDAVAALGLLVQDVFALYPVDTLVARFTANDSLSFYACGTVGFRRRRSVAVDDDHEFVRYTLRRAEARINRRVWKDRFDVVPSLGAEPNRDDGKAPSVKDAGSDHWVFRGRAEVLETAADAAATVDGTIADIGAGTGALTRRLLDRDCRVVAVEPSDVMRREFQLNLPGLPVRDGHFLDLPLPGESVMGVASTYAWHHLSPLCKRWSLYEAARVLRPGGVWVCGDAMFESADDRAKQRRTARRIGNTTFIEDIDDEPFALVDETLANLKDLGFVHVRAKHIVGPGWVVSARKSKGL